MYILEQVVKCNFAECRCQIMKFKLLFLHDHQIQNEIFNLWADNFPIEKQKRFMLQPNFLSKLTKMQNLNFKSQSIRNMDRCGKYVTECVKFKRYLYFMFSICVFSMNLPSIGHQEAERDGVFKQLNSSVN